MKRTGKPRFFRTMCLGLATGVIAVALQSTPAQAVVFDAASLPQCFTQDSPFIPPQKQRTTIHLEIHLCEEPNHVKALFVGDRIQPGTAIALGWVGQYWQGYLKLTQSTNAGNNRQVDASGWVQHLVPSVAPRFNFSGLTGGGTGNPQVETIRAIGGSVPHESVSDDYFLDFLLDEGTALFGLSPGSSHNVTRRGWLIELEGFHGPGPFDFSNPPKPFEVQLEAVPLPAAGLLLLAALAGLSVVRGRRTGS
ncbi:VPLPA-CTERM sorting domain-containing protein [Meridianimarinicoccus sp. MJW13]|uniref:VPLPA-CTERM sorting domain-containing protein n=2 Tax=unclassified Meridianimarinicoccus TaxID=2923344 RepID=UPI0018677A4D|nr:VPLPA-CTERM sorting domain-containing protein [Fluviibacterium sp. MJW13]